MTDPTPPAPKPKPIAQWIAQSLEAAWDQLTMPAAIIQDRERRQQARLLSSLLLALILAIMLTLIIRAIGGVLWQDFAALASVGAMAIFIGIYRLSRTHHYTISASLTVAALFAVIHTAPLWADRADQVLFYASLPILFSSMLLSLPTMLGVAGVSIGSLLLLARISLVGTDFYIAPLSQMLITATIIVTFIHHRDLLERERQAALRTSETNYRLLLEQASDGIFITDPQGNYLLVNSKGREMLGSSTGELLLLNIKDIIVSEDSTHTPVRFDELSIGKTVIAECRLRGKKEILIPVEVSVKRLDDGRLQAIVRDITERKRAEDALRQFEARFAKVFYASPTAIVLSVLATGHYLNVNDSYLRLVGYRREEIIGHTSLELGIWPNPLERTRLVEVVREHGSVRDMEITVRQKSGAIRYALTSAELIDLDGQLCLLGMLHDITERKQAEEALRRSEEKYRLVVESSLQGIAMLQDNRIVFVNPAMCQIMGYSASELTSFSPEQILATVYPEDQVTALERSRARRQGQPVPPHYEYRIVRSDGTLRWLETYTTSMVYEGEPGLLSISLDITERKILEEQLRQSQKIEAIGRLAGGIAHDFNNILTVIKGYTGLLLQDLDAHDPLSTDIGQIQKSAERAAELTRQLLAFSRKQILQPVVLDLNAIVTSTDKMLQRLIGEDVNLTILLDPGLGRIKADPGQIEQVIINLALNARDAMPQGGKLTIETKFVYLDKTYARQHVGVKAGPYIMLAISDTGSGMDEETRSHIFEPFFTTKEQGKGTGLGLATVHGIVNQSGGHIWVYSELGQGTTFKVYLPRVEEAGQTANLDIQDPTPSGRGSETILLVEDEGLVRELAHRVLLNEGYIVLEASDGEEAIRVAQQHQGPIDLLITDVVMPGGMSGRQLVERLTPLRQEMKVLYMSGYTDNAIVHHGVLEAGIAFLQKPFTPNRLTSKVREVLDTPR